MKRFEAKIVRNKRWREVLADWVLIGKFLIVLAGVMVFLLVLARCFPVRMKAAVVTKISFVAPCGQGPWFHHKVRLRSEKGKGYRTNHGSPKTTCL